MAVTRGRGNTSFFCYNENRNFKEIKTMSELTVKNMSDLLDPEVTPEAKMQIVVDLTEQRLLNILPKQNGVKVKEVPTELEYIVTNVSMARYARVGQEGMSGYSQDGLNMVFRKDDFDPYMSEINSFGDDGSEGGSSRGKVKMVF